MAKEADKTMTLGPFKGGLNLQSDPTDMLDTQVAEALNFDSDPNGALKSRPPFVNAGSPMQLGASGDAKLLGFYYSNDGAVYLLASDGLSSTWAFSSGVWTLVTNTFAASAMAQFDGKAWLVAPFSEASPGGYWTPSGGFVSDSSMPKGSDIAVYKDRMWVASGRGSSSPTSMFYSKLIVEGTIWASAASREVQVAPGDGQAIIALKPYYGSLLVFRNQSIYSYSYATSTAAATISIIAPGIGLASRECLVAYESYLYFMYDNKAYEFVGNRAQRINQQVPFSAGDASDVAMPFAVSTLGKRILFAYYDYLYVFNVDTRVWTRWSSTSWGAIAQVLEPIPGTSPTDAFAVPSVAQGPGVVNESTNPCAGVSTANWGGQSSSGGAAVSMSRLTGLADPLLSRSTGFRITTTSAIASYFGGLAAPNAVSPGEVVSLGLKARAGVAHTVRAIVEWYDASSAFLASETVDSRPVSPSVWTLLSGTSNPAPSLAATYRVIVRISQPAVLGETLDWTEVIPTTTSAPHTYFDGNTAGAAWQGTADLSTSIFRALPVLQVNEALNASDSEPFVCILQTKNYSFDTPSAHKRMWWWGVDAVFRDTIKGTAHPIVQTQTTDWGALWTSGVTWADLLSSTWAAPIGSDAIIDIVTEYDTEGLGFLRKFVKLKKAMRFRQVHFRIEFTADGTINTSPVYLFTLRAKIAVRQFVAKAIS